MKWSVVFIALVGAIASPHAAAAQEGERPPLPPIVVEPLVVDDPDEPAVVTVSGEGCDPDEVAGFNEYVVSIYRRLPGWNSSIHDGVIPADDGTWTYSWKISNPDGVLGRAQSGIYTVRAHCIRTVPWETPSNYYPNEVSVIVAPGPDPEIDGPLTVSDPTPEPGDEVHVSGTSFIGSSIGVFLYPQQLHLGDFVPAGGELDADVVIPDSLAPGTYQIVAEGWQGGGIPGGIPAPGDLSYIRTLAGEITIAGPGTTPDPGDATDADDPTHPDDATHPDEASPGSPDETDETDDSTPGAESATSPTPAANGDSGGTALAGGLVATSSTERSSGGGSASGRLPLTGSTSGPMLAVVGAGLVAMGTIAGVARRRLRS